MPWRARWRRESAGPRGTRAATLRLILPSATISLLLAALAIMLVVLQVRDHVHAGGLVAVAACGVGVYHFARRIAFVLRMLRS